MNVREHEMLRAKKNYFIGAAGVGFFRCCTSVLGDNAANRFRG